MPKIRIRRKIRIRVVRDEVAKEKSATPKVRWHKPISLHDKDRKKAVLFDFSGDDEPNVETAPVVKLDAKTRKQIAAENLEAERRQRRLAHMQAIREEESRPIKAPAKPKPSVMVMTGKVQTPKIDKGTALGWVYKKDLLPMPAVDDALKIAIYANGVFVENAYARVMKILKSGIIVSKIADEVFWPKSHGLDRGSPLRIKQENIIRLVQNARWVDGKYYEPQTRKKSELETVIDQANDQAPPENREGDSGAAPQESGQPAEHPEQSNQGRVEGPTPEPDLQPSGASDDHSPVRSERRPRRTTAGNRRKAAPRAPKASARNPANRKARGSRSASASKLNGARRPAPRKAGHAPANRASSNRKGSRQAPPSGNAAHARKTRVSSGRGKSPVQQTRAR